MTTSPFAPRSLADAPSVGGVAMASAEAGIKYRNRRDLLLVTLAPGTMAAGVTTRSKTCSAPVVWCRRQLEHGVARALVVNAGNANAFTGLRGDKATTLTAEAAASAVGCQPHEVFLASTGVIGEPLDASRFVSLLDDLAATAQPDAWPAAAEAIMTTDTYPKLASRILTIDGKSVVVTGIAKGSGMIAPDMATMLSFVFTDVAIDRGLLQNLLTETTETTFNCITVDSDTSTSDTLLAFATGAARNTEITSAGHADYETFRKAFHAVLEDLALQVVKDGEGITKFVTVEVSGAENPLAAKRIALSIANSPLVKTAIAGEDANWGRVVMAVGKAGEAADRDALAIWFGPHQVASAGERAPDYSEDTVAGYMRAPEILIRADVGVGSGAARVWTCDLTHGYISINADYRS